MSTFAHRALMLDPARLLEHHERYHFWLPWLREWGYNTLHLHLTDDEGCALVFPRRPELATPGAFTADDMRALLRAARRQRLTVIPEIESLGHTRYITNLRRYRHLLARPPGGTHGNAGGFNALLPDHPESRRLLRDLFRDTADIFDNDVIHAGLDEVDLSRLLGVGRQREATDWAAFARHATWVHETIRRVGRRPAMWGDHLLAAPAMAAQFQRDLLIFDWHYDPGVRGHSLDRLHTLGFAIWAAPATLCWRTRLVSNAENFANVREFTAHALARSRFVTGVVNTVWCPYRHLPGAMDWPIAWAGHIFSAHKEDPDYCRHFCRSFYGLPAAEAPRVADALALLHASAPAFQLYDDVMEGQGAHPPRFTREHQRRCAALVRPFATAARALGRGVRHATRNGDRLHDVALSSRLLAHWARFGASGLQKDARAPGVGLSAACRATWRRARPSPPDRRLGGTQHALAILAPAE